MKPLNTITTLILFSCMPGCSGPEEASVTVDPAMSYAAFEDASNHPDANISHEGDWKVVSRVENGDRVYWFVAPDVDKVSPALFKKTIHAENKNEKVTVIVSKCDAPKQTCDSLMDQFKVMSKKYK
jgi:hypothetical protein